MSRKDLIPDEQAKHVYSIIRLLELEPDDIWDTPTGTCELYVTEDVDYLVYLYYDKSISHIEVRHED